MKPILYQLLKSSLNQYYFTASIIFILILASNCVEKKPDETTNSITKIKIVPEPAKILYKRDYFKLEKSSRVLLNLSNEKSKEVGTYLINSILNKTNYKLKIADRFTTTKISSGIELIMEQYQSIQPEGFKIVISKNKIKILANDINGLFYGSNVVLQLFTKNNGQWLAPQISIEDYPKTNWRGLYLNFEDSIKNEKILSDLLKKNRINYLITSEKWIKNNNAFLKIGDTTDYSNNWQQYISQQKNVKQFYLNTNNSKEKIIFEIIDPALLHPDSIAVIGESMWTIASKLDYQELLNHLDSTSLD